MMLAAFVFVALAQLPASPDPKPVPVAGIVVDSDGRPCVDVDVWLAEAIGPDEGHRFGMELWWAAVTRSDQGTAPVLVHARTDAAGRFTIDIPAEAVARRSPVPMAIWAADTGKDARIARYRLPRIVLADDPPIRIELGPAAHAEITVLGPDGKPVAAARVVPVRAGELPIPEPLGQSLAATSEASGRAIIAGLSPASIAAIRVEAPGFGMQVIELREPESGNPASGNPASGMTRTGAVGIGVTLAPVGRIVGRLVAPGGEPVRGVTVRATSQVGGYAGSGQTGSAVVACDPQGRFEIPAIAAGKLALSLEFDRKEGTTLRGEAPGKLAVEAGRSTEVTIPLRATLDVQGLVLEKGTGRPIAGLTVHLNSHLGGDGLAVTDARGKFAGRVVREVNQPFGWPMRILSPFFEPADMIYPRQSMPRREVAELALPPLTLSRGVDVRGRVVGENDRSVAGAEVEAIWTGGEGQAQAVMARTDRTGAFTLHGVDPLAELSLTAWDGFASTPAVSARAESAITRPITLAVSPKDTTRVGGRVVDAVGKPVAGALVRIRRQVRDKNGRLIVVDPIADGDGSMVIRTDADGRYRTRRRFPSHFEFVAEASAPGRLSSRSPVIAATPGSDEFADLVLRRVRTVEGRVVDRQGRPVAGAVVRQSGDGPMPTEAVSGKQGDFRLPGVIEGAAPVFAAKEGFRFAYRWVDDGSHPAEVVLARAAEPPAAAYRSLPSALPIEEEKAMARRLVLPPAETFSRHAKDADKFRFLIDTLDVDPVATLEQLDSTRFADADYLKALRTNLAAALCREHLDEAAELVEAGDAPDARAEGYLAICDARRDLRPEQVKELLVQAGVNAKGMKSAPARIRVEARVADRWLDLGETGPARALLDDAMALGRDTTKGIKDGGYNLGLVAESLARLDLPAALKVLDDLGRDAVKNDKSDKTFVFQRFFGHIAYNLSARSPADAERVLGRMPIEQGSDRYVVAACSGMAPRDLARARRIAGSRISRDGPGYRPHALGLMARSIAATDKAAAIRLIDDAYAALDRLAVVGDRPAHPGVVEVAAALLPTVERVAPDRLAEFLGRTLALRPSRGDQTDTDEATGAGTTASLAMMVARYDRPLAARLLEPELRKNGSRATPFGMDNVTWRVLSALALIDPRRAVERVEALPEDPAPGTDPYAVKNRSRISVARLLALHDADRWRLIHEQFLYLWTPDQGYL